MAEVVSRKANNSLKNKQNSSNASNNSRYYYVAGVIKFRDRKAGYPDVKKIAQDWVDKDPNFKQVLVRLVNQGSWGIQFVYIYKANKAKAGDHGLYINKFIRKYIAPLLDKDLLYARDLAEDPLDQGDLIKWEDFNPEWIK